MSANPTRRNGHEPPLGPAGVSRAAAGLLPEDTAINLDDPALYLNRELTWLAFNRRILAEAEDERNPLLERVKFMAITGSNLDEFFMKRIGGLKQQVAAGVPQPTIDGHTPQQQIDDCHDWIRAFERDRLEVEQHLLGLMAQRDIRVLSWDQLTDEQRAEVRAYYLHNVFPLVTPLALDPAHPFPFISNLSLNLLVTGDTPVSATTVTARIKVPIGEGIPRLLSVRGNHQFVLLEDVMAHTLDALLPGLNVLSCELFRVTRNANTERDEEEADDLLELIESEVQERRFAPIVRLEVAPSMDIQRRGMLTSELGLQDPDDVFEVAGMFAPRDLMGLLAINDLPDLRDPHFHALDPPRLPTGRNIFHSIRDGAPVLTMHPYESFAASVERMLRDASTDPKVRAIKMTLYRTSSDARMVSYLAAAARNGKQVAVVVELKARFDESANIAFAAQLEESGIHVSYGVVGLKTHCKVLLVVRRDHDGLRRYVHIGTGNYNPDTARLYADVGLITADPVVGEDAGELFNYLTTGYGTGRVYEKLIPGPGQLKAALLKRIEREHAHGSRGLIQFKMNALEDIDVTRALYRAARSGVKVDLIVRDTCCLRPGVPGISDSVRVVSIVGAFLEHARIYYFHNAGADEYLIGSADSMKRNLESRVEVLVPVEDGAARKALRTVLDLQLAPNRNAWLMHSDGTYVRASADTHDRGCQQRLLEWLATRDLAEPPAGHGRKGRRFARRSTRATPADEILR
jgi:polyphosphate kinase